MNPTKAVVLLSGGQDSTTCLFWAKHYLAYDGPVELHALSVYYGQRHAAELNAAHQIGRLADVASHVEVDLGALMMGGASDLLLANDQRRILPRGGMKDAAMPQGLPTSFVPGRNLMFLAAAVARAGAVGASHIVTGVCQTDYSGYPDCRQTFVNAMQAAINEAWPSMEAAPRIHTPLMRMTKKETVDLMVAMSVAEAKATGAPHLTPAWRALGVSLTCYYGKRPGCGECPACTLRARGFAEANVPDPAEEKTP